MAPIRKRAQPHVWTAFEQHTLLCLLCRQIQLTGASSSPPPPTTRPRKGGRAKASSFSLSKSVKHGHRDVADLLNRSLNRRNHADDIPAEEVSAMIDRLMDEKKAAVGLMERQTVGRVTRLMKRAWERSARVDGVAAGGKVRGGKGRGKAGAAAAALKGNEDRSDESVQGEIADDEDPDDPWGDKAAVSTALAHTDPWGDEDMTSFADGQGADDFWGVEHVVTSSAEAQDTIGPQGSIESTFVNKPSSEDPWGSIQSTFINTSSEDPWAPWTGTDDSSANKINSNDPWADSSPALPSTTTSDFISSQSRAQSVTTTTTGPPSSPNEKPAEKQAFPGLNSARLAMLGDADEESDDVIPERMASMNEGRGENAVELPFNRLARVDEKSGKGEMNMVAHDEMQISEEE